jgi:hypothetical protein
MRIRQWPRGKFWPWVCGVVPPLPSANSWFEFHFLPLLARFHPLVGHMRDLEVLLENLEEHIGLMGLDCVEEKKEVLDEKWYNEKKGVSHMLTCVKELHIHVYH